MKQAENELFSLTRFISPRTTVEFDCEVFHSAVRYLYRHSTPDCPNHIGLYSVILDAVKYYDNSDAYMREMCAIIENAQKRRYARIKKIRVNSTDKRRNHKILQYILSRRWDKSGGRNRLLFKNVAIILWLGDYSRLDVEMVIEHLIDNCNGKKMREVYNWFRFLKKKEENGEVPYVSEKELGRVWKKRS